MSPRKKYDVVEEVDLTIQRILDALPNAPAHIKVNLVVRHAIKVSILDVEGAIEDIDDLVEELTERRDALRVRLARLRVINNTLGGTSPEPSDREMTPDATLSNVKLTRSAAEHILLVLDERINGAQQALVKLAGRRALGAQPSHEVDLLFERLAELRTTQRFLHHFLDST